MKKIRHDQGLPRDWEMEEAVALLQDKTTDGKSFLSTLNDLEVARQNGDSSSEVLKALGKAYFFGRRHFLKPDYKKAFGTFSECNGDPECQYFLALCHSQGLGVSRSTEKALVYLSFAAKDGCEQAQLALGYRYAAGIGVPRTCSKARDLYYASAKKTIKPYQVDRQYKVAKPVRLPNKKEAQQDLVEYYEYSSNKDEPQTLQLLGQIYYEGYHGSKIDYQQARIYFEQAAAHGNPTSKGFLGEIYFYGLGVPRDPAKAFHYFREGAQGGSSIARNGLGILYRDGIEVLKDEDEALELFKKAAEDGHPDAQYNYGNLLYKTDKIAGDAKSLPFLVNAFQQGHVLAQFEIARRNVHNELVCTFALTMLRDLAEKRPEIELFDEAYEDYQAGDYPVALSKYIYLADFGHDVAQFNAAHILQMAGTHSAYRRALVYLHRSANQGSTEALLQVGDLFYAGNGIPAPNQVTAYVAYKKAYGRNNPQASFNLGYMYERGLGVPQDLYLARRYYDAAATLDTNDFAEAWLPVKLALLGLSFREATQKIGAVRQFAPHIITIILLILGSLVLLRKYVRRPFPNAP